MLWESWQFERNDPLAQNARGLMGMFVHNRVKNVDFWTNAR